MHYANKYHFKIGMKVMANNFDNDNILPVAW
jgi:hypothetical protein